MNAAEFPVKKHTISYYGTCKDCGWAIIFACCNDGFLDNMHKVHQHWDWWVYCANKGCVHHEGEGIFQNEIEWCIGG